MMSLTSPSSLLLSPAFVMKRHHLHTHLTSSILLVSVLISQCSMLSGRIPVSARKRIVWGDSGGKC